MLTVTLGLEESGKRRTRSPLGRAYSVMPSTAVTFRTPWGRVWERAVKAKIRRSGSNPLLRVIGRCRRIITVDVWGRVQVARWGWETREECRHECRHGSLKGYATHWFTGSV